MAKTEQMLFRTTTELRAVIERIAEREERSMAWVIGKLLEEALASRGEWPSKKEGRK